MGHRLTEAINRGGALAGGEQVSGQRRIAGADSADRGDRRMRGQPRAVGRHKNGTLGAEGCQYSTHSGAHDGGGGRCCSLRVRFELLGGFVRGEAGCGSQFHQFLGVGFQEVRLSRGIAGDRCGERFAGGVDGDPWCGLAIKQGTQPPGDGRVEVGRNPGWERAGQDNPGGTAGVVQQAG